MWRLKEKAEKKAEQFAAVFDDAADRALESPGSDSGASDMSEGER